MFVPYIETPSNRRLQAWVVYNVDIGLTAPPHLVWSALGPPISSTKPGLKILLR